MLSRVSGNFVRPPRLLQDLGCSFCGFLARCWPFVEEGEGVIFP